jgi:sterol desaturase/sphingolipid hydroxylase (fatty acid hydroxylase superfamily)
MGESISIHSKPTAIQQLHESLPVSDDLLALLVIMALMTLATIEWRKPYLRPGIRVIKESYLTNVTLFVFNDVTLSLLSIPALYLAAQHFEGFGLLGGLPDGPLKYAISFVLLDLAMFGWHYLSHHSDWLWKFHKVHHSDLTLNVTTGLRFHMAELLMEALVRVAFIAIIGVSAGVVLFTQTLISVFVLFHHTNITFPHEKKWARIFIVPRLHRVHHSILREEHDSNYGAVFSVWDRLFGTLQDKEPIAIGLADTEIVSIQDILKKGFKFKTLEISLSALAGYVQDAFRRGHYLRKPAYARAGETQSDRQDSA